MLVDNLVRDLMTQNLHGDLIRDVVVGGEESYNGTKSKCKYGFNEKGTCQSEVESAIVKVHSWVSGLLHKAATDKHKTVLDNSAGFQLNLKLPDNE